MTKDWLIRTKNNHILGPVTKEKIKQLISNGSIKGDDEVCSGNGYWVFVREQDLIARFVFGDENQGFNPVQEIDPVISVENVAAKSQTPDFSSGLDENGHPVDEFGNLMPAEEDLEYPDLMNMSDEEDHSQMDATLVDMNLSDLQTSSTNQNHSEDFSESEHFDEPIEELHPNDEDLEYPDMLATAATPMVDDTLPPSHEDLGKEEDEEEEQEQEVAQPVEEFAELKKKRKAPVKRVRGKNTGITRRQGIPKKRETQVKVRTTPEYKKSNFTKKFLYSFIFILFVFVSLAMYFRKTLVKELLELGNLNIIPKTYAQETTESKKKSGFHS